MARIRGSQRGFTLIELMVVVVIMGILATLGIYSVMKYINAAKTSEAREILASIKAGQESYYNETYRYLAVSDDPDKFYPSNNLDGRIAVQWGATASGCSGAGSKTCDLGFKSLGVNPAGAVRFRYTSTAGAAATAPNTGGYPLLTNYDLSKVLVSGKSPTPWYFAKAAAAFSGEASGNYCVLATTSFQSEIYEQGCGN